MRVKTQFKTDIVERYKRGESSYQIGKNEGCSYNAVLRELKRRGINTGFRFWLSGRITDIIGKWIILTQGVYLDIILLEIQHLKSVGHWKIYNH